MGQILHSLTMICLNYSPVRLRSTCPETPRQLHDVWMKCCSSDQSFRGIGQEHHLRCCYIGAPVGDSIIFHQLLGPRRDGSDDQENSTLIDCSNPLFASLCCMFLCSFQLTLFKVYRYPKIKAFLCYAALCRRSTLFSVKKENVRREMRKKNADGSKQID